MSSSALTPPAIRQLGRAGLKRSGVSVVVIRADSPSMVTTFNKNDRLPAQRTKCRLSSGGVIRFLRRTRIDSADIRLESPPPERIVVSSVLILPARTGLFTKPSGDGKTIWSIWKSVSPMSGRRTFRQNDEQQAAGLKSDAIALKSGASDSPQTAKARLAKFATSANAAECVMN